VIKQMRSVYVMEHPAPKFAVDARGTFDHYLVETREDGALETLVADLPTR
jgi:hypothetical protein